MTNQPSRRTVLGFAAAAVAAPFAMSALPARAVSGTDYLRLGDWTHVYSASPMTSYWDRDRQEGAKVGRVYGGTGVYRSFIQIDATGATGGSVAEAKLHLKLTHSAVHTDTPVQLWLTDPIDRATEVTWANSAGYWRQLADVRYGSARGGETETLMFVGSVLTEGVRTALAAGAPAITFGLRAPDESSQYLWKKFDPASAVLEVTYE